MKLSELKKTAGGAIPVPGGSVEPSEDAADAVGSAAPSPAEEPQGVTTVTPSGIEIAYEWAPRRLYRLRQIEDHISHTPSEWREVPSVTTVLGVLDKSGPLTWWGQGVGVEGTLELLKRKQIRHYQGAYMVGGEMGSDGLLGASEATKDNVTALLTEHKLTVNHVKDKAADRGVNVHGALEAWVEHGALPDSNLSPEHERGYVQGLYEFLCAISYVTKHDSVQSELMVGSLEHQYAGRFDLVLTLSKPVEVVTRCYPVKKDKVEEIPAGRYLMDLKTRKKASVYDTNFLQLEAYEAAAVECGYQPTDYRAVIVVTEDGGYQLSVNKDFCFQDFLAVRECYRVMNEREILRILREDLDATEVK